MVSADKSDSHPSPRTLFRTSGPTRPCAMVTCFSLFTFVIPTGVRASPNRAFDSVSVRVPLTDSALDNNELGFKSTVQNSVVVGELSHVCSPLVPKCLYLARIGRLDILWSVNKLARAVTKWTKACDKRLALLFSEIHHTSEI